VESSYLDNRVSGSLKVFLLVLVLAFATSVRAEGTGSQASTAIEETVVTASYLGSSEVGDSGNAKILEGSELALNPTLGLGDALGRFSLVFPLPTLAARSAGRPFEVLRVTEWQF
jgi:hypothetical protein